MNRKKIRFIENIIIVTFPVVLFAGCAGSDVKPTMEENSLATYSEYNNPLPKSDLVDISTAYEISSVSELSVAENTSLNEPSESNHISHNDTDIASHDSAPYTPYSESKLSQEQNAPSVIHVTSSSPVLPINNIIKYDTNKHELLDEQQAELKLHAEYLIANPDMILVINGHADVRGTENYNQALSEKRAQAVYELLLELGVAQGQLKKFSFGEHQPLHDEDNWNENRRVELEFKDPVILSSMQ